MLRYIGYIGKKNLIYQVEYLFFKIRIIFQSSIFRHRIKLRITAGIEIWRFVNVATLDVLLI